MKKIVMAALLSAFVAAPAVAADTKGNVGVNFSTAGAFGIQGEFNISSMTNNAPVSVQAFWKHYSQDVGPNASWGTTGIGITGIYDFSSLAKLDKKIHPYAGVGLMSVSYSWRGTGNSWPYTGVGGGLYVTAGVRYDLTPQVAADLNYNNFGDLTAGVNFNF
jgi:opacity protein-like surface antigen